MCCSSPSPLRQEILGPASCGPFSYITLELLRQDLSVSLRVFGLLNVSLVPMLQTGHSYSSCFGGKRPVDKEVDGDAVEVQSAAVEDVDVISADPSKVKSSSLGLVSRWSISI